MKRYPGLDPSTMDARQMMEYMEREDSSPPSEGQIREVLNLLQGSGIRRGRLHELLGTGVIADVFRAGSKGHFADDYFDSDADETREIKRLRVQHALMLTPPYSSDVVGYAEIDQQTKFSAYAMERAGIKRCDPLFRRPALANEWCVPGVQQYCVMSFDREDRMPQSMKEIRRLFWALRIHSMGLRGLVEGVALWKRSQRRKRARRLSGMLRIRRSRRARGLVKGVARWKRSQRKERVVLVVMDMPQEQIYSYGSWGAAWDSKDPTRIIELGPETQITEEMRFLYHGTGV